MGIKAKVFLLLAWFPTVTLSLLLSISLLRSYSKTTNIDTLLKIQAKQMLPKNEFQFYAALPQVLGSFSTVVAKEDARPEILKQFLIAHQSPIAPYAQTIVEESDKHDVDFRLITAIAMCESNLGKRIPEGSHNAWGYAIYTGASSGAVFQSWEDGIGVMAKYLSEKYYSRGLTTPDEIGPIYAPPSVNTGNSWAKCVKTFMNELI